MLPPAVKQAYSLNRRGNFQSLLCYNTPEASFLWLETSAMQCWTWRILGIAAVYLWPAALMAAEPTAIERGRKALLEHNYSPTAITRKGFDQLWQQWGLENQPDQ